MQGSEWSCVGVRVVSAGSSCTCWVRVLWSCKCVFGGCCVQARLCPWLLFVVCGRVCIVWLPHPAFECVARVNILSMCAWALGVLPCSPISLILADESHGPFEERVQHMVESQQHRVLHVDEALLLHKFRKKDGSEVGHGHWAPFVCCVLVWLVC